MDMIPLSQFYQEVKEYDPAKLVELCAGGSRELEKSNQTIYQNQVDGQSAIITHHSFAAPAMLAIRNYPQSKHKVPSLSDVIPLANKVYSIENPFLGTSASGIVTSIRA
jgi:hypothetical protein